MVLDAPDARLLGGFYRRLLGWEVVEDEPEWVVLRPPGGGTGLSVKHTPGYVPPVWPAEPAAQQMMAHLDVVVQDLGAAAAHAVVLGAVLAEHQPQDHVLVHLDPAGHPFCLYVEQRALGGPAAGAETGAQTGARTGAGTGAGTQTIGWRPLAAADLPLLARWLAEPPVARWWNHETTPAALERDFGASVRGEEAGEDLVVLLDGRPVGLLQRSRIADYPEDLGELASLVDVPAGAVTIDYLLSEDAPRGQGAGTRLIATAVARTWLDHPDAPAVLVAVVAGNIASWRALEKAGLRRVAEGDLAPDNPLDPPLHYVYRVDRPPHE